jgi:hypothetical protein
VLLGAEDIVSVDAIIGKTLYGREDVALKRIASDNAASVGSTPVGTPVGIVYSYLLPGPGRSSLYWMFLDDSGNAYYAEHQPGRFSFESLRAQGVLTTEEQIQAEIEKNKPWEDKVIDAGKWIAIVAVVGFVAVQLVPKLFSTPSQSS